MLCFAKAFGAWVVLVFVGMNLIGFLVRGLVWVTPSVDGPTDRVREILESEAKRLSMANITMTLISAVVIVAYLWALNHYWNIALALTAVLTMLARLPDLLWEIRYGKKVSREDMPKSAMYYVALAIMLLCLPLTWYALCG